MLSKKIFFQAETGTPIRITGSYTTPQHFTILQNVLRNQRPKVQIPLENLKEEVEDDVFVSPSSIPSSPSRAMKRKSVKMEPFFGTTTPFHTGHQSKLRAPRVKDIGTPPPYTPAPMLSPNRPGQGLYWQAITSATSSSSWPTSTTIGIPFSPFSLSPCIC